MTTLVTGFEPFADHAANPSQLLAEALADECVTAVLSVDFVACIKGIRGLIDEHRPDVVLSIGLAPNRTSIEVERVAVNLIDATIPDNRGFQPADQPVVPGGPDAFFATLPVKTMVTAIRSAGLMAGLSMSAGTYGCNAVMYAALEYSSHMPDTTRPLCGFMHVPPVSTMPIEDQLRAVRAALSVARRPESSYTAGKVS